MNKHMRGGQICPLIAQSNLGKKKIKNNNIITITMKKDYSNHKDKNNNGEDKYSSKNKYNGTK